MIFIRKLGLIIFLLTVICLVVVIALRNQASAIPDLSSGDEYIVKQLESSGGHRLLVSMHRATISGGELSKFSNGRAEVRLATRGATNQDPRYTFRAKTESGNSGSNFFFKYGYTTGTCSSTSTLDRKMYVKKNVANWSLIAEGGTQSVELSDAATQAGKYLCLELGWIDLENPNTAQTPKYVKFKLENEAPNVEFSENADGSLSLTANADLKIFKFYYARLSSGSCASLAVSAFKKLESSVSGVIDSASDTSNSLVAKAQITFNSAQAGNSYCFAARDIHGNFGRSRSAWTIIGPLAITNIEIDRNDNELRAAANRKVGVSWSYVSDDFINNINDYTCNAGTFSGQTLTNSNVIRLNDDNAGSTNFCFKATRGSETVYRKIRAPSLNQRPLVITITKSGSTLTASADARYIHNWRYVSSATRVACNKPSEFNKLTASSGNTVTLDSTNRDHTFCFTAQGNNNWRAVGYGIYPDKTPTTITFERSGDVLTATASTSVISRSHWTYGIRDDATCNKEAHNSSRGRTNPDTASGQSAKVDLQAKHQDKWLCFWVVPANANLFAHGYASYRVAADNTQTPDPNGDLTPSPDREKTPQDPPPDGTQTPRTNRDSSPDNDSRPTNQDTDSEPTDDAQTTDQDQTLDEESDSEDTDTSNDDSLAVPVADESELPNNWDELTNAEKVDLNPFGCDIETEWMWATDGSCHPKVTETEEPVEELVEVPVEEEIPVESPEPEIKQPIEESVAIATPKEESKVSSSLSWFILLIIFILGIASALLVWKFYLNRKD